MDRRTYLTTIGIMGLAGCASIPGFGTGDESTPSPTASASPTDSPTPTGTLTPLPTPTPFPFRQTNPWFEPDENEFADDYASSGGGRLGPGEFGALSWSDDGRFTIRYAFATADEKPIDALLMGSSGYDSFIETQSAGILSDGSVMGESRGEVSIDLNGGTYYLVFDNSVAGATRPDGEVEFVYGAETI